MNSLFCACQLFECGGTFVLVPQKQCSVHLHVYFSSFPSREIYYWFWWNILYILSGNSVEQTFPSDKYASQMIWWSRSANFYAKRLHSCIKCNNLRLSALENSYLHAHEILRFHFYWPLFVLLKWNSFVKWNICISFERSLFQPNETCPGWANFKQWFSSLLFSCVQL